MNPIHEWAVALARDVAPDEADLAPSMVDAYLAGGQSRQALLDESRGPIGGFDSGIVALLMPVVLHATGLAVPAIGTLLVSKHTDYLLGCLKSSLSITEIGLKGQKLFGLKKTVASTSPSAANAGSATALTTAGDIICTELRARGLSEEQADSITYRVLIRLLEEPRTAELLVTRLSAK